MDSATLSALQRHLEDAVRAESAANRAHYDRLWSQAVAHRVEKGRCLKGLEFREFARDGTIRFACTEENTSDFREGDLVRLSRGDSRLPALRRANLFRVEDDAIWVVPARGEAAGADLRTGEWVLDACFLDLESFYRDAMLEVGTTARGRDRILPLFGGGLEPSLDSDAFIAAGDQADAAGANESQSEAIASAVATDLCHLVQGPPGTGKTYALAQIVAQRFARGERILVTGLTHRAIHHALSMIVRVAPEIGAIAKIGRPVFDPDLAVPQHETFAESALAGVEAGYVVGATPFALRGKALRGVGFDVIVVDEASQVTLPLAVMAMLAADTFIFIGDEKQLPPVQLSVEPGEAAAHSVFSHLRDRGFGTMLKTTYRMNEKLTRWPSESFYSGLLRAAPANARRRLALPGVPDNFAELLDPAHPFVFVELDHAVCRNYSVAEATLCADLVETLFRAGFPLAEVAVIVPFRRQARWVRNFLRKKLRLPEMEARACTVDTVDRLQGQERELVIVSMTASDPGYLESLASFLLRPQRLNVAITRARTKVIVLASAGIAALDPVDPDACDLVEIWRTLRAAAHIIDWREHKD